MDPFSADGGSAAASGWMTHACRCIVLIVDPSICRRRVAVDGRRDACDFDLHEITETTIAEKMSVSLVFLPVYYDSRVCSSRHSVAMALDCHPANLGSTSAGTHTIYRSRRTSS